jgi:hypothetical protein
MKTKSNKSKRHYTKRGTTVAGKRVVLIDGKPVGRGRPAKEGKGTRTVVFIPLGESYDATKHGVGVRFNTAFHGVVRRLKVEANTAPVETVETYEATPVVAPVAETAPVAAPVENVAETVATAEAAVGGEQKW